MAVDGSIHISTKLDVSGVNQGTKAIGSAVKRNVASPVQSLVKSLGNILKSVVTIAKGLGVAVIAALGIATVAIGKMLFDLARNVLSEFDLLTGSSGEKFRALSESLETLKGAFVNLLVQAIVPLIPYLVDFANKLTEILQTVTQIVAALFGFDKTVGGIMTKAASGAKKAAKEAKGALASFDAINVLNTQKPTDETPEGAIATPGPLSIPEGLLNQVDALKAKMLELWDSISEKNANFIKLLQFLWDEFKKSPFFEIFAETFKRLWDNFITTLTKIKDAAVRILTGIVQFVVGIFRGDWEMAWEGIKNIVGGIFDALKAMIEGSIKTWLILLVGFVDVLKAILEPIFAAIAKKWEELTTNIKTLWADIVSWFTANVFNPIANGFLSALTTIKQSFTTTFNGIRDFVKGTINSIIDFLNRMIDGVVNGINAVIGSANAIAGLAGLPEISPVSAPKIPRLATGAVIPPNAEFLAILGDQKNGKNLEAPAAMFEEMLQRAAQSGGGEITVTVPVYLDNEVIYKGQQRVSRRHGKSLIASGAV